MMVWVLFVFMNSYQDVPVAYAYPSMKECYVASETYKRATCVQVHVPHPKRSQR